MCGGFSLEEVGSPVHEGFSLEEIGSPVYGGFSLVKLPQSLSGWAVRPRDLFLFPLDRRTGGGSPWEDCLVLRGVIGYACQGHGTSTFGPVLTPGLPEVSLIPHTVKFSKYSAVKKSTSLCSAQLFSDVLGHRLLFAPVMPMNIDLHWCPVFRW